MTRSLLLTALLCVTLSHAERSEATVYENGGGASRWDIIDNSPSGARIRGVKESGRGRVVSAEGRIGNAFRLGGGSSRWYNNEEFVISWDMKTKKDFGFYVILATERGNRYLRYTDETYSRLMYKPKYIDHGLGQAAIDGRWRTHVRDLAADLAAGEPGNRIVSVNGVFFRGDARIDEIELQSSHEAISMPAEVVAAVADEEPAPSPEVVPTPAPEPVASPKLPVPIPSAALPVAQTDPSGRQLAFPGAEGYGRFARGGRGGRVVIVNTLRDVVSANDGLTSLREALEVMSGPRTVVFEVGGIFDTGNQVILMNGEPDSYVTLACQSAPTPGVLIRGAGIRIRGGAHDIVMRHCEIRNIDPGRGLADSSRSIGVVGKGAGTRDMIFDHMSLGWATDETFTVWVSRTATGHVRDITLSRSIVAEGDADSTHFESGLLPRRYMHSMGPSCNTGSSHFRVIGCSIIGNLMAHNGRRNPLMWGVSGEVSQNVIYNWRETALDARPHRYGRLDLQVHNNVFKSGPTSKIGNEPMVIIQEGGTRTNVSATGNRYVDGIGGGSRTYPSMKVGSPSIASSSPSPFRVDCVGASRPQRSAFDSRIVAEYNQGGGMTGIGSNHIRDYRGFGSSRHPGSHDSDRDGMADAWEIRNGFNPNDANDHRGDADRDGFTNIEEYLFEAGHC